MKNPSSKVEGSSPSDDDLFLVHSFSCPYLYITECLPQTLSTNISSRFPDPGTMAYFSEETPNWEWYDLHPLDLAQFHPPANFDFNNVPVEYSPIAAPLDNSSEYASTPIDTPSDPVDELSLVPSRKRQHSSESSLSDVRIPPKRTRRLRSPPETAKVREKGACFYCQKKRKEVQYPSTAIVLLLRLIAK